MKFTRAIVFFLLVSLIFNLILIIKYNQQDKKYKVQVSELKGNIEKMNIQKSDIILQMGENEKEIVKLRKEAESLTNIIKRLDNSKLKSIIRDSLLESVHIGFGQGQYPIKDKIFCDENGTEIIFAIDKKEFNNCIDIAKKLSVDFIDYNNFKIKTHGVGLCESYEDELGALCYLLSKIDFENNPYVEIDDIISKRLGLKTNKIPLVLSNE